jgi:hypothetical protein
VNSSMSKRKQLGASLEAEEANGGQSYPSESTPSLPHFSRYPPSTSVPGNSPPEIALSRLSLQRCRSMLGPACGLTDAQVLKLRDSLYDLANVVLEGKKNGNVSSNYQN